MMNSLIFGFHAGLKFHTYDQGIKSGKQKYEKGNRDNDSHGPVKKFRKLEQGENDNAYHRQKKKPRKTYPGIPVLLLFLFFCFDIFDGHFHIFFFLFHGIRLQCK